MPPVGTAAVHNHLVDFLKTYGPSAASHSIWDEHVVKAAVQHAVAPLDVYSALVEKLVENFRSTEPQNVILTGTAGDGKTWHCRQIYVKLGGTIEEWDKSGALIEMTIGGRKLIIVKDLSEFYEHARQKEILDGLLPAILGRSPDNLYLVAANDGQLLRFWRGYSAINPEAGDIERRTSVLLKEDRDTDDGLSLLLLNLSRQPHDTLFDEVVKAIVNHPDWDKCNDCVLAEKECCAIRRNLQLIAVDGENGMRAKLRELITIAAHNDMHLPMRHVILLIVNIILGVSKKKTWMMNCDAAQALYSNDEAALSNPYDNALGLNLPSGLNRQYRAFTVFENIGIGRETNNAIDGVLVDAQPEAEYEQLVKADPVHGDSQFSPIRYRYQRGTLEDFAEFKAALEAQRRRLLFSMKRSGSDNELDPWKLTVFTFGGDYLDFIRALAMNKAVEKTRHRLVVGLNRSYTGTMCDDGQEVWFAAPAANTQSRVGRVLDIALHVGRSPRHTMYFDFDANGPHGRPRMLVRLNPSGEILEHNYLSPLLFEYLMRVQNGSLPGSFSRQCFEELRHFRLRVIAALTRQGYIEVNAMEDLHLIRLGDDGNLRAEAIEVTGGI